MKPSVSIVIPLYKSHPLNSELCAFRQCYEILGQHDIYVVTYKDLSLEEYNDSVKQKICCKFFDKKYFESIDGYNTLLKTHSFYKAFNNYDYILIYQLDAWVFTDSLMYWCRQKYDYIGAPWFSDYGSYEGGQQLWTVGNGGFSLRRVKKFLYLTNPKTKFLSVREVFKTYYKGYKSLPSCVLKCFGRKNNVAHYSGIFLELNEDVYFSIILSQYERLRLHIPDAEQAAYFAFERSPRYLFKLTNNTLPFGCHAWEKYDINFWEDKILL